MGIFSRAKQAIEPRPITNVHNHEATKWSEIAIILAMALVAVVVLGWHGVVFVLGEAGVERPERALAQGLIWFVIGVVLMVAGHWWFTSFTDRLFAHRERMARIEAEIMEQQAKLNASKLADQRVIDPELGRLYRLVVAIMVEAYARECDYSATDSRPWARRTAGQITLAGERQPVGETLAGKAGAYLRANEIIIGANGREQVNFEAYPDIASIERRMYDVPVIYR